MPNEVQLLDPAHEAIDIFSQKITQDIWADKYKYRNETSPGITLERTIRGIFKDDQDSQAYAKALSLIQAGIIIPAGRIIAGAGTDKKVTLMNCYVMDTIPDSMEGIMRVLAESAKTLQQSGGIGLDFSTLRPLGAPLRTLGGSAKAAGPVAFMPLWDALGGTLQSSGARRGAMMATMRVDHPDIERFIESKHQAGALTNFNISVLITDEFMAAIKENKMFQLRWGEYQYNEQVSARGLWDKIMRSTYEYSEPGVIFIDRVNKLNNLKYCETISATNPCGEQGLPPYGACDLGHINLARLVQAPFEADAGFDWITLSKAVEVMVRVLDNVIDITEYPSEPQRFEAFSKRRIGLGVTGLADALVMMDIRYGSKEAIEFTESVSRHIKVCAYEVSIKLAKERGPFPQFVADKFLESPNVQSLPTSVQKSIREHGIRNGTLLTVAPTGTTSILFGNVSSGIEPIFSLQAKRKVMEPDGSWKEYTTYDYAYNLWRTTFGELAPLPLAFMTAAEVTPKQHVEMQAAYQKHVDASISKTVNCPENMAFEDFQYIYMHAYQSGCKGCTTYRPSEMRGSILEEVTGTLEKAEDIRGFSASATEKLHDGATDESESPVADESFKSELAPILNDLAKPERMKRPDILDGSTYKVDWPNADGKLFVTINDTLEGQPFEIFISSKSAKYQEWTTALTRLITSLMRMNIPIDFVVDDFQKIASAHDSAWIGGKHYPSIIAYIGHIIEVHTSKKPTDPKHYHAEADEPGWPASYIQSGKLGDNTEDDVPKPLPPGVYEYKITAEDMERMTENGLSAFDPSRLKRKIPITDNAPEVPWVLKHCEKCGSSEIRHQEGCEVCERCGHSSCS